MLLVYRTTACKAQTAVIDNGGRALENGGGTGGDPVKLATVAVQPRKQGRLRDPNEARV